MHNTTNGTSPAPAAATKICDGYSVGVLVRDDKDRYLLIQRGTAPAGWAPVAGHVDNHGTSEDTARQEVYEEVGLTVHGPLEQVTGGWRPNRCRRVLPADRQAGHYWFVYQVEADAVSGTLTPSARETRGAAWLGVGELQHLADRAVAYAHGAVSDAEWAADPGLEPVWAEWLVEAGIVTVSGDDLARLDELAARSPVAPAAPQTFPAHALPVPVGEQVRAHLTRLDERGAADLIAATEAARAEIARTDTKSGILLAFTGTAFSVLAALVALASGLAVPARVGLALAVVLLAVSSAVVLTVVRPALSRRGQGTGVLAHAEADSPEELLETLADDPETRQAADVICLAQIARSKHGRLRCAVDLILAALAVVVVSLPLGL
ncbi:NUDIX domain-containing protein [Streptosporangium sp. NPDC051022]|uniref:NUDIX domain-containing protein n=1 Tax=Streptosporangium sp. NPDC051022 TaxID=3155752 RepID=UPI00343CA5BA